MTIDGFADCYRLRVRRDVDGTDIIAGKLGQIYGYDDDLLGVLVMPDPPRRQYWGHAKAKLLAAGFRIRQDGDGEGSASFDSTNAGQAKLAIKVAGIKGRRACSAAQLSQLKEARCKSPINARAPVGRRHSAPQDAPIETRMASGPSEEE